MVVHPKRGSVLWANLDPTVGSEIQKTRPVVVVSPDELNDVLSTVIVVPLTSHGYAAPFHARVSIGSSQYALCDHVRSVDRRRLGRPMGMLAESELTAVLAILRDMFEP